MKKLLFIISFLLSAFVSFSQYPNKVRISNNQTIYSPPVLKADSSFMLPIKDTLNNQSTFYPGALTVRPQDTIGHAIFPIYQSNGIYWSKISSSFIVDIGVDSITLYNGLLCQWIRDTATCWFLTPATGGDVDSFHLNFDSTYIYQYRNGALRDSIFLLHTKLYVDPAHFQVTNGYLTPYGVLIEATYLLDSVYASPFGTSFNYYRYANGQIDSLAAGGSGGNTIYAGRGLLKLSDSLTLISNFIPPYKIPLIGTVNYEGHSIVFNNVFPPLIASATNTSVNNTAIASSISKDVVYRRFTNAETINTTQALSTNYGIVDLLTANTTSTSNGIANSLATITVNQFLDSFYAINNSRITFTGAWSSLTTVNTLISKSLIKSLGTPQKSSTAGDKFSLVHRGSDFVLGYFGVIAGASFGSFKVTIDGVILDTVDVKGRTDNAASILTTFDNRMPCVYVATGLGEGFHTVEVELLENLEVGFDYVGRLKTPATSQPVMVYQIAKTKANFYSPTTINTEARIDQANEKIDSVVKIFRDLGYPVGLVQTNNYFDTSNTTDGLHPTAAGDVQLASAGLSVVDTFPQNNASWKTSLNRGISGAYRIGTNNNTSFPIFTNNTQRMIVDSTGKIGIGIIANPSYLVTTNGPVYLADPAGVSAVIASNNAIRGLGDWYLDGGPALGGIIHLRSTTFDIQSTTTNGNASNWTTVNSSPTAAESGYNINHLNIFNIKSDSSITRFNDNSVIRNLGIRAATTLINDSNIAVIAGNPPCASCVLELRSSSRGLVIPRMTTAQRNAIVLTGVSGGQIVAGSGYTSGNYPAVALTGGSGSGATAKITVGSGVVQVVSIVAPGTGYAINDVLSSSSIGGGSLFTYIVDALSGPAGMLVYDTDLASTFQLSAAGAWQNLYNAGGGGITALSAIGSTPNANAATITGTTLNLEPASASFGGVVTTGTQTFAGAKTFGALTATTFNGNTFTAGTGVLTIGAGKTLTVSNTLTFAGTDGSTLNIGTGGTLGTNAYTSTAYLPLAGGTMVGNILATDNTYNLGAASATRFNSGFFGTLLQAPKLKGSVTANDSLVLIANTASSGNTGTVAGIGFDVGNSGQTRAMTILQNGDIGIGTTSPSQKIEVIGNSTNSGQAIVVVTNPTTWNVSGFVMNSTNGGNNNLEFFINGVEKGWIAYDVASNRMRLGTNVADRLTIQSNGNVGIGTTSPTAVLHLKAGTATASTSPEKFTAGVVLTTPESGALETNSTNDLFYTNSGAVRARVGMWSYKAITATYTILNSDYTLEATSGTFTATLPTAVGIAGRVYIVTNSGAGVLTLGTTSSETFVNVLTAPTTLTINQYSSVTVQSNGAAWLRLTNL